MKLDPLTTPCQKLVRDAVELLKISPCFPASFSATYPSELRDSVEMEFVTVL